jgi:hypothetical protein
MRKCIPRKAQSKYTQNPQNEMQKHLANAVLNFAGFALHYPLRLCVEMHLLQQ